MPPCWPRWSAPASRSSARRWPACRLSFAQTIARLEDEIRELAGEDFNIGSPKQLGEILFDKMSLPGGRRTKTGAWSTDAAALEELAARRPRSAAQGARLAAAWPSSRAPTPTRCRPTSTRRRGACTPLTRWPRPPRAGCPRKSRTCRTSRCARQEGRSIRKAFVAEKGKKLISADYSQIELRVLAHMADTPTLRQAFADGLDIHAMTATRDVRRADRGHGPGHPPQGQGHQFRHHLRHLRGRARGAARHPAGRGRPPISRPISSASPASRTTWRR